MSFCLNKPGAAWFVFLKWTLTFLSVFHLNYDGTITWNELLFVKFHLVKASLRAWNIYLIRYTRDHLALGLHQPQQPSTCWHSDSWVLSSHYYIIPWVLSTQRGTTPTLAFHLDLGYIPVKFPDCTKTRVGQRGQVWGGHLPDFNLLAGTTPIFELSLHFDLNHTAEKTKNLFPNRQTDM